MKSAIFHEEWNAILSLSMIVLTLELLLIEEHPLNKNSVVNRMPNTGLELHKKYFSEKPIFAAEKSELTITNPL